MADAVCEEWGERVRARMDAAHEEIEARHLADDLDTERKRIDELTARVARLEGAPEDERVPLLDRIKGLETRVLSLELDEQPVSDPYELRPSVDWVAMVDQKPPDDTWCWIASDVTGSVLQAWWEEGHWFNISWIPEPSHWAPMTWPAPPPKPEELAKPRLQQVCEALGIED